MNNRVSNSDNRNPEYFAQATDENKLWDYVKSLSPETVNQLSRPSSPEVLEAVERTVVSMLGGLPADQFNVMITTNRENLGKLLASAMLNGYLLRNVEQRLAFEKSLGFLESDTSDAD